MGGKGSDRTSQLAYFAVDVSTCGIAPAIIGWQISTCALSTITTLARRQCGYHQDIDAISSLDDYDVALSRYPQDRPPPPKNKKKKKPFHHSQHVLLTMMESFFLFVCLFFFVTGEENLQGKWHGGKCLPKVQNLQETPT